MESLDFAVIISAVALGLTGLATLARFFNWFIHSNPATMARTTHWMLLVLFAICLAILVVMVLRGQWSVAMFVAAVTLLIPTMFKWRTLLAPLRAAFSFFRPKARVLDMEIWDDDMRDPETVRRAAAILEAYVGQVPKDALTYDGRPIDPEKMSEAEALDVLGLKPGADEAEIRAAHRRLIRLVHPDHSGSTYLSRKVSQAKDTLLPGQSKLLRPFRQRDSG